MNIQHFLHVQNKLAETIGKTDFLTWLPTDGVIPFKEYGNSLDHVALLNVLIEIMSGCKTHFRISDKDVDENGFDTLNIEYQTAYDTMQMELAFLNIAKSVTEEDEENDDGIDFFEFYLHCKGAIIDEDGELYNEVIEILNNSSDDEILKAIFDHVKYLKEYLFAE